MTTFSFATIHPGEYPAPQTLSKSDLTLYGTVAQGERPKGVVGGSSPPGSTSGNYRSG